MVAPAPNERNDGPSQRVRIALPNTATYRNRWCEWERLTDSSGLLTISQTRGRKVETDTYAVEIVPTEGMSRARAFLLENVTRTDPPDTHCTEIDTMRGEGCTCKAGICRRPRCKHRDALKALIARGLV